MIATIAKVGRPRQIENEQIFRATRRGIARVGSAQLTLALIAGDLGCTRQALNRRFGSKHQLLAEYLAWMLDRTRERFEMLRTQYESPLAALMAQFSGPTEELLDPEELEGDTANVYAFFAEAQGDPILRQIIAERRLTYEIGIRALLDGAVVAGELVPCDTLALSEILYDASAGAFYSEAMAPHRRKVSRMYRNCSVILQPFLAKTSSK